MDVLFELRFRSSALVFLLVFEAGLLRCAGLLLGGLAKAAFALFLQGWGVSCLVRARLLGGLQIPDRLEHLPTLLLTLYIIQHALHHLDAADQLALVLLESLPLDRMQLGRVATIVHNPLQKSGLVALPRTSLATVLAVRHQRGFDASVLRVGRLDFDGVQGTRHVAVFVLGQAVQAVPRV